MRDQRDAGLLNRGGGDQKSDHRVLTKPGDSPITLAEVGIDKTLADRARKYAAVPDDGLSIAPRLLTWLGVFHAPGDQRRAKAFSILVIVRSIG